MHYRKLNKFIKFKKNISNNFNVFDRINLFLYKNKIHFSPLYKNKQVFATKELIIKKKPVCYKKKPFLVYKKLNILFVKNTFIYKFIIFNLKKINLLDLNIIYKIHNFFHDIRETKKVFLSKKRKRRRKRRYTFFTQVNKIHFRIASKSIKIKNIINFIILNTIKKDTIYLDLTHFFFYIKNFNVLKITKDNYITNIELFFNNTVNFNLKFNRFSYSFVLPSKGIIGRSNFNAIRPFLFLTGFKNKKNKKFALKNKINTFFKFYVHNFNSRKINAMYFKKKVGLSRRRGRINFFFPIKYSLQEIIKRKKIVFIQKQRIFKVKKPFIKKPFKKTIKILLSSKNQTNSKQLLYNNNVILDTLFENYLYTDFNKNKDSFLIMFNNKNMLLESIRTNLKIRKKIFSFNNIKDNLNLLLNERYYYFLLIRYNLPYLNKIISKISLNNDIKWEFFITRKRNMNAQDIGNFLKKSLKKRRYQRRLLNPIDLIKNQLGDNLIYLNKINIIKKNILNKNLFSLFHLNNNYLFKNSFNSFDLTTLYYKKLNQFIWKLQYKKLNSKLNSTSIVLEQLKNNLLIDTNKFFFSKINLVDKRRTYLLKKNPIFFDNISFIYKQNIFSLNKNNLIRKKNLFVNNLENSFLNILNNFTLNKKILFNTKIFTPMIEVDENINKLINKQFIQLVRGFQITGLGRLGSSSKSTRSNITIYKTGKTMKNSYNLSVDFDFKTQITRNGIYSLKVAKFYQTFNIKKFIQQNCANYLL